MQVTANQVQDALVLDAAPNAHHELVVVDLVEELRQVDVHDPIVARFDIFPRELDRIVSASARSKPKAEIAERGVEDRREHLKERLLNQAIRDAWNP